MIQRLCTVVVYLPGKLTASTSLVRDVEYLGHHVRNTVSGNNIKIRLAFPFPKGKCIYQVMDLIFSESGLQLHQGNDLGQCDRCRGAS